MPNFKQIFHGDTPTFRFEFKTKDGSVLPEGIAAVFVIESKCGAEVFHNENLLDENGTVNFRLPRTVSLSMFPGEYRWGVSLKYNADNADAADWQTPEGNGKLFVETNAAFSGADNAANAPIRSAIDPIVYEVNPYQTQLISTSNYADLTGKPQINGVELIGNQNAETLGLLASDALADYRNSEAQDLIDNTKFNAAKQYTDNQIAAAQPGNFSLQQAGLIKGTANLAPTDGNIFGANDGKLFGENDGTGSLIGWGRLIAFVQGLYTSITEALNRIVTHNHSGGEDGTKIEYGNIANTPSSLPPSGPAGGDLSGTYPNPTLKPIEIEEFSDSVSLTFGSSFFSIANGFDGRGRVTQNSRRTYTMPSTIDAATAAKNLSPIVQNLKSPEFKSIGGNSLSMSSVLATGGQFDNPSGIVYALCNRSDSQSWARKFYYQCRNASAVGGVATLEITAMGSGNADNANNYNALGIFQTADSAIVAPTCNFVRTSAGLIYLKIDWHIGRQKQLSLLAATYFGAEFSYIQSLDESTASLYPESNCVITSIQ